MLVLAILLALGAGGPAAVSPAVFSVQRVGHDYDLSIYPDGHLERSIDKKPVLGPMPHIDPQLIKKLLREVLVADRRGPRAGCTLESTSTGQPTMWSASYRGRILEWSECGKDDRGMMGDAAEALDRAFELSAV